MVAVSVVIPTRGRPALLSRCLRALTQQTFRDFEVVVVEDGPTGASRECVELWLAKLKIRWRPLSCPLGPAAARNAGVVLATGEFIAFTDDDTIPAPGWLHAGVTALRSGAVAVSGRTRVPLPPAPTDYQRDTAGLAGAEFLTANAFCRREALEAIGVFDERFTLAWREDSDLHFALLERFGSDAVQRVDDALVVHPVRPAPWGVSLRLQSKSRFNALLFKKHPTLYRERVQPRPPWRYYGTIAAAVVAGSAAAAGVAVPAGAAAGAWAALYGDLLHRRLRGTSHQWHHVAEMALTSALIPWLSVSWRLFGALRYRTLFL